MGDEKKKVTGHALWKFSHKGISMFGGFSSEKNEIPTPHHSTTTQPEGTRAGHHTPEE